MKTSQLIGRTMVHKTDPAVTGEVTDVLLDIGLEEVVFLLVDVVMAEERAPVLFSPTVLVLDDDVLKTSAHPDDIAARHDASFHRMKVAVNPSELPNTFIGPFGNTFSPSMIMALFNARTGAELPKPQPQENGVWFKELQGRAVRAHVGDVGHIQDVILGPDLKTCDAVEIVTPSDQSRMCAPQSLHIKRLENHELLLSISQHDDLS